MSYIDAALPTPSAAYPRVTPSLTNSLRISCKAPRVLSLQQVVASPCTVICLQARSLTGLVARAADTWRSRSGTRMGAPCTSASATPAASRRRPRLRRPQGPLGIVWLTQVRHALVTSHVSA